MDKLALGILILLATPNLPLTSLVVRQHMLVSLNIHAIRTFLLNEEVTVFLDTTHRLVDRYQNVKGLKQTGYFLYRFWCLLKVCNIWSFRLCK